MTGVTFGAATASKTFDNAAGASTVTTVSAVGTGGAFASPGGETGSPGLITTPASPASASVTEIAPWGSGTTTYAADWFELTNTGSTALDLAGWKMDDGSEAFTTAVALNGVSALAPGESAIFLEGDVSKVGPFRSAWATPAGLQIGFYSGGGVGLSTDGDGVSVFDQRGRPVAKVSFGTSTNKVSFDNVAGDATVTTLSAVGVHGAYTSAAGETGSPGRTVTPAPPSSGGDGETSTPPVVAPIATPPSAAAPSSIPPTTSSAPTSGGTTPVTAPTAPSTTETPSKPAVSVPGSVKTGQLRKGVRTKLEELDPGSRITIEIRSGGKKIKSLKARANAKGAGQVKLKLSKRQIAKLGKKLTVRYTVMGADGQKRTLTHTIEIA